MYTKWWNELQWKLIETLKLSHAYIMVNFFNILVLVFKVFHYIEVIKIVNELWLSWILKFS